MYESSYNTSPTITLNPFTDSLEAVAVFKANKEFLDSLDKAIVDAGGNPKVIVRPDVTLTELMNILGVNGVRFWFDPNSKKGSNSDIPVNNGDVPVTLPELSTDHVSTDVPTVLPENNAAVITEGV